jgi:hypothetical protein
MPVVSLFCQIELVQSQEALLLEREKLLEQVHMRLDPVTVGKAW